MVKPLDRRNTGRERPRLCGALQQALREDLPEGTARWRTAVEEGLSAAYAAGDIVALCEVVQAIVSLLDAQGRHRDAVSEISHAIALARDEPNALAMLNSMSATLFAGCGDFEAARNAVSESARALPAANIPLAAAKCRANCAVAQLLVLEPGAADTSAFGLDAPDDTRTAESLFLMSYAVPYKFASGARAEVHPWLRTFRLQAKAAKHQYRLAGARTFEAAEATILDPLRPLDIGEIPRWHWLANWRAAVLSFGSRCCAAAGQAPKDSLTGRLAGSWV